MSIKAMSSIISVSMLLFSILMSCNTPASSGESNTKSVDTQSSPASNTAQFENLDTATVAGGCFWCVEASFEQIKGVEEAVSGYAGGEEVNPTYKDVSYGRTGHTETVQVYYDADVIDYKTLLKIFFTAHDPTQLNRQGPDIGPQYRSAIFYHDEQQLQIAENMMDSLNKAGVYNKEIVTELNPYTIFYKAEEYHQDYEEKNPNDRYIQNVSLPKIKKVQREFSGLLKEE